MENKISGKKKEVSRRSFIKRSAAMGMTAMLAGREKLFASSGDELKVGLIGCGFRGTGATIQALTCSSHPVKLWAMGDMFGDKLKASVEQLRTGGKGKYDRDDFPSLSDKMDVPIERQFVGFDAYQKVINSGVDIVILATPPHFRPAHLRAAVETGKHVFMEKPVAVDPVGVRSIISSSELAKEKGLSIVAGTQRRYQESYIEVMRRIHRGDIGELVGGQSYFMVGHSKDSHYFNERQPGWSDMEWQLRNWYYFTWLSGDHFVEQYVHCIDVMNWAFGTHPVKAIGVGGRQVRTGAEYGNIYDHFAIEFEYPNGARCLSMSRQTNGCSNRMSERIVGTKGTACTRKGVIEGQNPYKHEGEEANPYIQEHAELVKSILTGKPINDGRQVAESTLSVILGRMCAYTGRELKYDWVMKASKLDLTPPKYEFGDLPVREVAIPGQTKLI
ncbi:MAG: Gfo/Idh/MocA family oxidoreductase [Planctomycetota bacterium]|jgi:predicted dehydrogenase